ncbi:hypothetical protein OnM2_031048 [Erysiphe neolycopersici]|uniref:Uncharacterized protein n=1 Tax=Erysiphe neolycopersici TaxID=212602 RepID=A0A420HZ43_9PEZI|nr:hypothetical protein OnM2_031048 [Erysiphe neolycopersici]
MREFKNLINALNTESKENHADLAKLKEDDNNNNNNKDKDKYLATLSATMKRIEAKIDSLETTRPSGLNTIKKLAPDTMPGPHHLRSENLSGADTPTFEIHIRVRKIGSVSTIFRGRQSMK